MNSQSPTQSGIEKEEDASQRRAAAAFRAILLLVPAIVGFLVAFAILTVMSPFGNTWEFLAWLLIALIVSFVTSIFVGDFTLSRLTGGALYNRANTFDTTVEELFGSTLREGNPKNIKRQAEARGLDAKFIDDVILLLTQLGDHERLTRGHSERVRAYSSMIGKEMGLKPSELEQLNWSALLHDIGKLDVPPWILTSPDRPSGADWETLSRHPEAARHRLRRLESTLGPTIYHGATEHHERWDGTGYPLGLAGGDISLFGRITAVADAFDVITHARSYKQAQTIADARAELMKQSGTQFDPDVVAAFIRIGDEDLKAVRGWSATIAGVALTGSRLASVGSQAVVVAATVVGAGAASQSSVTTIPAAVAFERPITTTTIAPATTTTQAPTTTTTTTTTIAPTTTTTTTIPTRLLTVVYEIGSNQIDGLDVELTAVDSLEVFFDGELNQTIEVAEGERIISIVFDVTDIASGVHPVRFDLYSEGTLISSDETVVIS